jgi:hypothetical protein
VQKLLPPWGEAGWGFLTEQVMEFDHVQGSKD